MNTHNRDPVCPRCVAGAVVFDSGDRFPANAEDAIANVLFAPHRYCAQHAADVCLHCTSSAAFCRSFHGQQRKCCPDCKHFACVHCETRLEHCAPGFYRAMQLGRLNPEAEPCCAQCDHGPNPTTEDR